MDYVMVNTWAAVSSQAGNRVHVQQSLGSLDGLIRTVDTGARLLVMDGRLH